MRDLYRWATKSSCRLELIVGTAEEAKELCPMIVLDARTVDNSEEIIINFEDFEKNDIFLIIERLYRAGFEMIPA